MCRLAVFAKVGVLHITRSGKCLMEGKCGVESVWGVSSLGELEIVAKERTICRMCAIFDDCFSTLDRRFATKVGNALVGDYDAYGVLAVVEV